MTFFRSGNPKGFEARCPCPEVDALVLSYNMRLLEWLLRCFKCAWAFLDGFLVELWRIYHYISTLYGPAAEAALAMSYGLSADWEDEIFEQSFLPEVTQQEPICP